LADLIEPDVAQGEAMKFSLRVQEETKQVETGQTDRDQTFSVRVDEKTFGVRAGRVSHGFYHLRIDGMAVRAMVLRQGQTKEVFLNGRVYRVTDEGQVRTRSRRAHLESAGHVTPPMPAIVVRILVKEGDLVTRGQGLIVVSAMKMETTLAAPKAGRVIRVLTTLNAKVAPGDRLVEIQEEGKPHE
jgi:3-methylcrotonyl-CoA carboxylase alpha subunit